MYFEIIYSFSFLVTAGAAVAATVYALDLLALGQLFFGYTANAGRAKVGIAWLDAPQTAQLLEAGLQGTKKAYEFKTLPSPAVLVSPVSISQ